MRLNDLAQSSIRHVPSVYAYLVWVFVFALTGVLLRLVFILSVLYPPHWCQSLADFWLRPLGTGSPLLDMISLTTTLTFIWILAMMLLRWQRPIVDRLVLGLAAVAVATVGVWLVLTNAASIDLSTFGERQELVRFEIDPPLGEPFVEDPCEAATAYVGKWTVVSSNLVSRNDTFPRDWIEFRGDLTFVASNGSMLPRVEGRWSPSNSSFGTGGVHGPGINGYWDFMLQGETLTLRTGGWSDEEDAPYSEVVLERSQESE